MIDRHWKNYTIKQKIYTKQFILTDNYSDLVISLGQSSGDSPGKESGWVCMEYG